VDPVGGPRKLAAYVLSRLREQSLIVDPDEAIDPYSGWTKYGDPTRMELASLQAIREPAELTARLRRVCDVQLARGPVDAAGLAFLREALALAPRTEGGFAGELVARVLPAFAGLSGEVGGRDQAEAVLRQCEALERVVWVVARVRQPDLARAVAGLVADLAGRFPLASRFGLLGRVAGPCVRALRDLSLRDELGRLAGRLRGAVGTTPPDPHSPEAVGVYLQSRLALAGAWLALGVAAEAAPILEDVRTALLATGRPRWDSASYTDLARAYVAAVGEGPPEAGLPRVMALFGEMPPDRITNTWATAPYFSRLHLNLTETAVAAACRMLLARPQPG
jgi:hypothetical protein